MLNKIDHAFKNLFQKDVQITLKDKTYKKGRFVNFRVNGCYITLIIQTDKKVETIEVPFPFLIIQTDNTVTLDYKLDSLAEQDYDLLINLRTTTQVKKCKFYNSVLTITALN